MNELIKHALYDCFPASALMRLVRAKKVGLSEATEAYFAKYRNASRQYSLKAHEKFESNYQYDNDI